MRSWLANRCTRTSSAAVLLLLTVAPAASAGTATAEKHSVTFTAAAGEVNTIEVGVGTDGMFITDTTSPLQGRGGCRNRDPHTVLCRGESNLEANLGDMADTARALAPNGVLYVQIAGGAGDDQLSGLHVTLSGGEGDDHLIGDAERETLNGDAGDDRLEGLGGEDNLSGGSGNDTLLGGDGHDSLQGGGDIRGAPAGADHVEGGPGNDSLQDGDAIAGAPPGPDMLIAGEGEDYLYAYSSRRRAVTVDLTRTDGQGERGENDTISGFESAYGGDGDDTLIGDDGPNQLDGQAGQDDIRGGGGDDQLVSVPRSTEERPNHRAARYGPDRVTGDAGDDRIETLPTLESEVTCGDGFDRVFLTGYSEDHSPSSLGPLVSATCERLAMGASKYRGGPFSLTPYPTAITRDAFVFTVQATGCCRRRFELQTLEERPRPLAATTARKPTRLTVPRAAGHARRGVRGKIEHVARNRFVWRFRTGF